jgi:hypothetical protein
MSHVEAHPGTIRPQESSSPKIDHRRKGIGRLTSSARERAIFVIGSGFLLITLWIASPLTAILTIALAQGEHKNIAPRVAALPSNREPELTALAFDPAILPSLDAIDTRTDITAFLRSDVPTDLRLAALRRAWRADPAIRDFKGMQENGWDFDRPNGIPGFGELGPEVDVAQMVARILGDAPRLELARSTALLRRRP